MTNAKQFITDVSPALVLLDVTGRQHPVLGAERAEAAIAAADALYEVGGAGRTRTMMAYDKPDMTPFLLYYVSHSGKPKRAEIARAARVIARSELTLPDEPMYEGMEKRVSGGRAVVFPERAGAVSGAVPFLLSKRIWFNRNRSTIGMPLIAEDYDHELQLVVEDINARLMEGEVSIPR